MEGDEPLDISSIFTSKLEDKVGVSEALLDELDALQDAGGEPYEAKRQELMKILNEFMAVEDNIMAVVAAVKERVMGEPGWDHNVMHQVIAAELMTHGWKLPQSVRKDAIAGAKNDEWAQEDDGRKARMAEFIQLIKSYDDKTPTVVESRGLMETIFAKAAESGHFVNVNTGPIGGRHKRRQLRKNRRVNKSWMN